MLTSINPLGERAKGNRFSVTASAHVVGALLGGAALGLLGAAVGVASDMVLGTSGRAVVLAGVALVAVVLERQADRIAGWRRQVDEGWLDEFRGSVYGFGFGVQLGFGLVTIITSASTWLVVAAIALQGSVAASICVGAVFGAVRGLDLLRVSGVRSGAQLRSLMRTHHERAPVVARRTVWAMGTGGGALLVAAMVS